MQRKLTITIDEQVYNGLHRVIGKGNISQFIEKLTRPHVLGVDLAAEYSAAASDHEREHEADEWCEGLMGDAHEAR